MKTKFTKGEWSVNSIDLVDYKSLAVISEQAQKVICHCHLSDMKLSKENIGNAKLIAAAPDLFDALSFCISVMKSNGIFELSEKMAIEKAEQAIKKATE